MSDDLPDLLRTFDPDVLRRMESQADTIAAAMLARRSVPRPRQWRDEVHFPRGTTEFSLLHRMADDPQVLTLILDRAVQRQTADDDRQWRVSPIDEALCNTYLHSLAVMLHPVDLDVSNLAEAPPELLIFQLNTRAPYGISESPPSTPRQIAYHRENRNADLDTRRGHWRKQQQEHRERLLVILRGEMARQRATLPPNVARALEDMLTKIMSTPYGNIEPLLEVASYLGVLDSILPSGTPNQADE